MYKQQGGTYYTHKQMVQMIERTRSWTLNNPSGPLPYLPMDLDSVHSHEELYSTLPEYKNPHWLIKLLMSFKII